MDGLQAHDSLQQLSVQMQETGDTDVSQSEAAACSPRATGNRVLGFHFLFLASLVAHNALMSYFSRSAPIVSIF